MMTPREKILREGLESIKAYGSIYGGAADRLADIARETIAKAAAAPEDVTIHEAVKHEREFLQDIFLVVQMNDGFLPGHQMRSIKDWLEQPLPL